MHAPDYRFGFLWTKISRTSIFGLIPCFLPQKRSTLLSVLVLVAALATEGALASWFPLRIGRRQSRATAHHPVSQLPEKESLFPEKESQIHRIRGRPTGSVRWPPVVVVMQQRKVTRLPR